MKIDRRKKVQYFRNAYSYKDVYVHKENDTYKVGINGTSHHYSGLPWFKAEIMVTSLVMQRI